MCVYISMYINIYIYIYIYMYILYVYAIYIQPYEIFPLPPLWLVVAHPPPNPWGGWRDDRIFMLRRRQAS